MASETTRVVPLTCHGHSRPITHLSFSALQEPSTTPNNNNNNASSNTTSYYLISACKDNNPMLRDGTTGDWIGTFIGHKGAVWSSRLSSDASLAITGSADFTARVWDTFTGECKAILPHNHIVRAVAFSPTDSSSTRPKRAATGGLEKKLRIWNLESLYSNATSSDGAPTPSSVTAPASTISTAKTIELDASSYATEIAPGEHTATIKSILWTSDPNILITACDDNKIRWFDVRDSSAPPVAVHVVEGTIGSCELGDALSPAPSPSSEEPSPAPAPAPPTANTADASPATPAPSGTSTNAHSASTSQSDNKAIVSVAAGKHVYFFDATKQTLIKRVSLGHEGSCVALHGASRRFVTGATGDTWVRLWDYDSERELETAKGHHGPVWTMAFSPDGALYSSGSEDGTVKLWKAVKSAYGLWR